MVQSINRKHESIDAALGGNLIPEPMRQQSGVESSQVERRRFQPPQAVDRSRGPEDWNIGRDVNGYVGHGLHLASLHLWSVLVASILKRLGWFVTSLFPLAQRLSARPASVTQVFDFACPCQSVSQANVCRHSAGGSISAAACPPASFRPLPARRLTARTVMSWSQKL